MVSDGVIHQPEVRTSNEILRKIIGQKPLAIDYMNAGHVAWAMGDIQKAAALYGKSITANGNRERFLEMFRKDEEALLKQGIQEEDIPLMLDYYNFFSSPYSFCMGSPHYIVEAAGNRLYPYISDPFLHPISSRFIHRLILIHIILNFFFGQGTNSTSDAAVKTLRHSVVVRQTPVKT